MAAKKNLPYREDFLAALLDLDIGLVFLSRGYVRCALSSKRLPTESSNNY
jgi:hypothetical protein